MEKNRLKNKWLALTVLAMSVSIIVIDSTIVNVSLPVIMKDLNLNFSDAEWIVTLYSLVFSALLLTTGRLADHFGRKKMLIIGITVFVIGSLLASLSINLQLLLLARFIQGLGGAIVLPTTLSAVNASFFGKDRTIAFIVWGSVISGMAAVGPLLGGFFTTYFTWHWIFLVNIPIGLLIILGALKFVPETYGEKITGHFDFLGFFLSTTGLALLVYALIEGRTFGWWKPKGDHFSLLNLSIIPFILFIAISLLLLFLYWEKYLVKHNRSYLLDLSLFRSKNFSIGNLIALIVAVGESGLLFLIPLFLQNVLALSPMQSGGILAIMGLGAFLAGGLASELVKKSSPIAVVSLGLFLEGLGFLGFYLTVKPGIPTGLILLWLFIYGVGLGFASAQLTSIVLVDVPGNTSGQGSSVQSTIRQIGSALGIAIISTLLVVNLQKEIPNSTADLTLPKQEQTQIEESVIQSVGASILTIKEANPKSYHLSKIEKSKLTTSLDKYFTKSVSRTLGFASIIILVSFLLTFCLYSPKHKNS